MHDLELCSQWHYLLVLLDKHGFKRGDIIRVDINNVELQVQGSKNGKPRRLMSSPFFGNCSLGEDSYHPIRDIDVGPSRGLSAHLREAEKLNRYTTTVDLIQVKITWESSRLIIHLDNMCEIHPHKTQLAA